MTETDERATIQTDRAGLTGRAAEDSCLMVIFGASGDLVGRTLLPCIFELALKDLRPRHFAVLGCARRNWSDADFRDRMRAAVSQRSDFDPARWDSFARGLHYLSGDFTEKQDYRELARRIAALSREADLPDNIFFHLAVPPDFFGTIVDGLHAADLE